MRKKENLLYILLFIVVYKGDGIKKIVKSITLGCKKNKSDNTI